MAKKKIIITCSIICIVIVLLGILYFTIANKKFETNIVDESKEVETNSNDEVKSISISEYSKNNLDDSMKFEEIMGYINVFKNSELSSDFIILSTIYKYLSDNYDEVYKENYTVIITKEELKYAVNKLWGSDVLYKDKNIDCTKIIQFTSIEYENNKYIIKFPIPNDSECESSTSLECNSGYYKMLENTVTEDDLIIKTYKIPYFVQDWNNSTVTFYEDETKANLLKQFDNYDSPFNFSEITSSDLVLAKTFKYYYKKIDTDKYIFLKKEQV